MLPYKAMRSALLWCCLSVPGPRCESLKLRDPLGQGGQQCRNARHVWSSSGICFTGPKSSPVVWKYVLCEHITPDEPCFPCESRTYQMSLDAFKHFKINSNSRMLWRCCGIVRELLRHHWLPQKWIMWHFCHNSSLKWFSHFMEVILIWPSDYNCHNWC